MPGVTFLRSKLAFVGSAVELSATRLDREF